MADWVCAKNRGGWGGGESDKEREKERKWKHVCEKTHQGDEMAIVHRINSALGCVCIEGSRKAEFTKQKKNKKFGGKWGFTGINTFNHIEGAVI